MNKFVKVIIKEIRKGTQSFKPNSFRGDAFFCGFEYRMKRKMHHTVVIGERTYVVKDDGGLELDGKDISDLMGVFGKWGVRRAIRHWNAKKLQKEAEEELKKLNEGL